MVSLANAARGKTTFAICGIPGAGKTTLAEGLSEAMGWPLIETGNLARLVDRDAMVRGDLADESIFAGYFAAVYEPLSKSPVVIDGLPRTEQQLAYLPADITQVILLTCRGDVAVERLRRRGREDDTEALIEKRIKDQTALLGLDDSTPVSWARKEAGWAACVSTTYKTPEQLLRDVVAFIKGERREAF